MSDYLSHGMWAREFAAEILRTCPASSSWMRWKSVIPFFQQSRRRAYEAGFEIGVLAALLLVEEVQAFVAVEKPCAQGDPA